MKPAYVQYTFNEDFGDRLNKNLIQLYAGTCHFLFTTAVIFRGKTEESSIAAKIWTCIQETSTSKICRDVDHHVVFCGVP